MSNRPKAWQKFIHRLLMLRPVTAFFAVWFPRLDHAILRLTNGKFALSEVAGWKIIQLTALGAKTKQLRTLPLVALFDGEKIALIASNFGRKHHPGWYYNLKAHPECEVQRHGHASKYIARETEGDERRKYWEMALTYYAGYEKYQERAGRRIPIMVLEPKS